MFGRFVIGAAVALTLLSSTVAPALAQDAGRREKGNLVIEGVPEIPQELADRMLQYLNTRSAIGWDWDPTGQGVLIFTRFGETAQIHRVAGPLQYREQLTFFPEPIDGATVNPDPARRSFLFTKDVGGSEFYQVFHFDMATGRSKMLTNGKDRYGSTVWANKGDRFAYHSTERNRTDWDLWVMDPLKPGSAKMVLSEGGSWAVLDWSPDDTKLLVLKDVSINETYLHVLDLATGRLTPVRPVGQEKISFGTGVFSKDGKGVFFTSDEGSEFRHLRYVDLATGAQRDVSGDLPWDVEDLEISEDGRTLAFTANEDGVEVLYLQPTGGGARRKVRGLPEGVVDGLRFDPAGKRVAVSVNGSATPGDVFVMDVGKGGVTRWTRSEVGGLDTAAFVEPKLVRFPTFDGRQVPAFLYQPRGDGPFPVVVNIHGGPESQFQPYFSSLTQFLVNEMGIAVVAPNVRGSSGYGKTYLQLDNGFLREDSVKDIGALLDWVATQKSLDASRVAVMGGSYGGYMTLASMTHYNARLKAGIDVVGISNFVTFLKNTQDYRRDLRRVEYGDERDEKMARFLESISPTTNAHKISIPLFVVQGKNDPRVPWTEAEQMVEVVRKNGRDVWYLMATDEGHGFRKKTNRDFYLQSVVLFLQEHLLGK